MAIRTVVQAAFASALALAAVPPQALAQHVVTDAEAGKLTFDMLTATPRPAVRHVAYRPSRILWAESGRYRPVSGLHMASYRHAARAAAHGAFLRRHRG